MTFSCIKDSRMLVFSSLFPVNAARTFFISWLEAWRMLAVLMTSSIICQYQVKIYFQIWMIDIFANCRYEAWINKFINLNWKSQADLRKPSVGKKIHLNYVMRSKNHLSSVNSKPAVGPLEDLSNLKINETSNKPGRDTRKNHLECSYCEGFCEKRKCPAYGSRCGHCQKMNHNEVTCLKKLDQRQSMKFVGAEDGAKKKVKWVVDWTLGGRLDIGW